MTEAELRERLRVLHDTAQVIAALAKETLGLTFPAEVCDHEWVFGMASCGNDLCRVNHPVYHCAKGCGAFKPLEPMGS